MSWAVRAAAALVGGLLALEALLLSDGLLREAVAGVAVAGLVLLAGALAWPRSFLAALAPACLLGALVLAIAAGPDRLDVRAPLVGAGLLVLVELLDVLATRGPAGVRREPALVARRIRFLATAIGGGLLAGALALLAGARSSAGDDEIVRLAAMLAAVVAVAVPVVLARRALR